MAKKGSVANYAAWLLMRDKEFLKAHEAVSPAVFGGGSLSYLVRMALNSWKTHRTTLSDAVVQSEIDTDTSGLRRYKTDDAKVQDAWDNLNNNFAVDKASLPSVRNTAHNWLVKKTMLLGIDKASVALASDDTDAARIAINNAQFKSIARGDVLTLSPTDNPPAVKVVKVRKDAYPTGLYDLDRAWRGGYCPGELGMIVGSTGVGKSMVACLMAANAIWRGGHVVYYTYELTPEQIEYRIKHAILQKSPTTVTQDWRTELALAAKARKIAVPTGWNLTIRNDTQTWPGIVADLDEYKLDHGKYPDLLIMDSADDVAPLVKRDARHTQLLEAFVFMRSEIAEARKIRVWSTGQLNRDSVDKARVNLRMIGDAFSKAQKSHYVLGFTQNEHDLQDASGPKLNVYVLKDSLHGTRGASFWCDSYWGVGNDGFPGLDIKTTKGLAP